MLFSSAKAIATTLFVTANATVGTLHLTNDFLRTLKNYPNSIADSTDMGMYWYKANIKKISEESGLVDYPWIEETNSDPKSKPQDSFFASSIFRKCYGLRNRRNYLFNSAEMKELRDWCTLDNDFLTEEFLEIFRWEFRKNCRIVWKKDPADVNRKNTRGWFLPFVLQRIHRERDVETFEKIRGIYDVWRENIYPWAETQRGSGTGCPLGIKYVALEHDDEEGTWSFDVNKSYEFNQKFQTTTEIYHIRS